MTEAGMNDLDIEIEAKAKNVHTQSYSMSIGGIKNLYDDVELDLHPEFQRFFRWTDEQKYKLIESILLGIPLPSFSFIKGLMVYGMSLMACNVYQQYLNLWEDLKTKKAKKFQL